jgi:hypothetical protein
MVDSPDDEDEPIASSSLHADRSESMLCEVLVGGTYDEVAAHHGITRTAVERRIKTLRESRRAPRSQRPERGRRGLRAPAAHASGGYSGSAAVLENEKHPVPVMPQVRLLSEEDLAAGARRVRARRPQFGR